MVLPTGTRLGAYEITGQIGAGGMGEVYRATDTTLGRDVAIKTLPSALAADEERLARFAREAKLLAALNHAHIASVYTLDDHESIRYLAMELVEGETLEQKLKGGAFPVEVASQYALQIAEALEAAHGKGVVHRDLKPANIMVTPEDVVKVLDFGLAKAFAGNPNEASPAHSPALSVAMTQQGLVIGTAGYMSPEQASGQATDQRADVWSFGAVLYEMLTGLPVFSGESVPHILAAVLQTDPDWGRLPENLHPRFKLLLQRCLAKKPRCRLHSIADARIELESISNDPTGIAARTAPGTEATGSKIRLAAAAVAGGLLVGLAGVTLWPEAEPAPVNRFSYSIPQDRGLRSVGRPVVALSPDGRRFAYNSNDGLYLRTLGELEARRLRGTEESLTNPFFSPDGQSVAYFAGGQLKRLALGGGAPIVITDGVSNLFGASWGADGTILYGQPEGIFRVPAAGGTPDLVIPVREGEMIYGPELLPDGDSVLFSATVTSSWDEAQVVVQSLSTGERTGLVSRGSDAHYLATGHLVYALGDGLFAVAFDSEALALSGGPVSLVQGTARFGATAAANYGIARDGTLVYLSATVFTTNLLGDPNTFVWVDRNGNEEPLAFDPCYCAAPVASPDGSRVALQVAPQLSMSGADVWIYSLLQGTRARLTFEEGFQLAPLWTPDGRAIVYESRGEGLFLRAADGTGATEQLLEAEYAEPWAWAGNDELIFAENTTSGWDIGVLTLADGERRSLLATEFNEYRPALSPDGRWLAYQSDESGQPEVYVRPYRDIDAGRWLVSSGGGQEPKWSQDGRLFFMSAAGLMEAEASTGAVFRVETRRVVLDRERYVLLNGPAREYDVSPDGERFLVLREPVAGPNSGEPGTLAEIVIVTNWIEELKQRVPTR